MLAPALAAGELDARAARCSSTIRSRRRDNPTPGRVPAVQRGALRRRTRTRATCSAPPRSIGGAVARRARRVLSRALSDLGADARDRRRRRRRRRDRARDQAVRRRARPQQGRARRRSPRAEARRPHRRASARSIAISIARRPTSSIGFPGATVDAPDRFALEVLVAILGGQSGRLFAELRDKQRARLSGLGALGRGRRSRASSRSTCRARPTSSRPRSPPCAASSREFATDGVTADELERAQSYLIGSHQIAMQRRAAVANAIAYHEAYGLGWQTLGRLRRRDPRGHPRRRRRRGRDLPARRSRDHRDRAPARRDPGRDEALAAAGGARSTAASSATVARQR